MSAPKALAAICEGARGVARKWQEIRANNADAAWDDFAFYKGNARWSAGACADLEALDPARFASAKEACDAATALVNRRGWDGDYDEPTAARGEILAAIEAARALEAELPPPPEPVSPPEPAPRPEPARAALPEPRDLRAAAGALEPGGPAPYRSAPRPGPPRYDGRPPLGSIFYLLVVCAALIGLFLGTLPAQVWLAPMFALIFALPAAGIALARPRTVIHEDRVEQTRWLRTRGLRLDDVRYVVRDGIGSMAAATRLSGALDSILLAGVDRAKLRLGADVPRDVRGEVVEAALTAAVRAANAEIASGGAYRSIDGWLGLDATSLHGFTAGLTLKHSSLPLAEVSISDAGYVRGAGGEGFYIGPGDAVLMQLLRERGAI